jgi:uncharacterized repeat protein (TIGR02543 family)
MSAFGTGSNSNGQFWFGGSSFPGFLYKKNAGVGGRRSTKFNPGGNILCNSPTYLYNKYKPGTGGVGASSMSNRRAKNRLATVCGPNQCFPCYNTLGQYSNYTHNPNGFIPCPAITSSSSVTPTPSPSGPYTVTYLGNGSNGGTVPVDGLSPYIAGSTVTVLGNTFTRAGFTFAGWSTNSAGTGSDYNGGDLFIINANTTLYAQWIPIISGDYTLTYNGNGGTGSEPALTTEYPGGTSVTVLGNSGSPVLTKTGYTFAGWNTAADGSGTPYSPTNTFTINANTILYAQWNPAYTLSYSNEIARQFGGGTAPAPTTSYSGGASVPILENTFTYIRSGITYRFGGWNTGLYGTGTYYDTTDILTMPWADTILYAQWYNPAGPDYQVIYNGNGSTTGTVPATAPYKSGQGVGISGNTGSLTKTSFTFYGWNTAANGLGTAYPITSNGFTMPAYNVTLYAQWVDTSATPYTLTYFGNDNTSGTVPSPPPYPSGASVSVSSPTIAKTGYTFIGWNTDIGGEGLNYSNNASIVMDSNKSLYAQWVGGVPVKSCPEDYNFQSISLGGTINNLYRDNTNNTMTCILQVKFSTGSPAAPYGTGNGPVDTAHPGSNMLSTYSKVVLSQVAGVYTFNIVYRTYWRNSTSGAIQTDTQTGTLSLGSTYWPTGQTIQDISDIITSGFASFSFSCDPVPAAPPAPTPSPQSSFIVSSSGCQSNSDGKPSYMTISPISTFYINFNNGTTTRVAIAGQTRWQGTANPYILNYNRTRIELANGNSPTTTGGIFPSSGTLTTTSFNSS